MGLELRHWKGEEAKKLIKLTAAQRLEAAAILLKNEAKQLISEPSPPPSAPGEPPGKDTGRLRASVSHEVDRGKMVARVGTNVVYGKFLELGTRKMAARPWLRKAFNENYAKLMKIIRGK